MTCYTISEPSLKTLPLQCSDPSVIKKVRWDSIVAWMKCSETALYKTVLHFLYNPHKFFFIALQSWSSRHVIQFLYLVSKHSPRQCSDPSVIKKVRWDSILAWMKCSTTALFKTVLHFFIHPPKFVLLHSKVGQKDMLYNFLWNSYSVLWGASRGSLRGYILTKFKTECEAFLS